MSKRLERKNRFLEKYSRFCDMVLLGALCFVTCIPVITIGPAAASMYYTVSKVYNRDEGYLYKTYWQQWKANMKQGIPLTLLVLLYTGVGAADVYLVNRLVAAGNAPEYFLVLIWLFFLPEVLVLPWIFAYIARFNDTVGNTLKNSLRLAISNPGATLLCDFMTAVMVLLLVFAAPVLPFLLTPMTRFWIKRTEPVLMEIAKNTEGFDPEAWYNR